MTPSTPEANSNPQQDADSPHIQNHNVPPEQHTIPDDSTQDAHARIPPVAACFKDTDNTIDADEVTTQDRFSRMMGVSLRPETMSNTHPTFQQLTTWARSRMSAPGEFLFPEHLGQCRSCLDIFESLCEAENGVSEPLHARGKALFATFAATTHQRPAPAPEPKIYTARPLSFASISTRDLVGAAILTIAAMLFVVITLRDSNRGQHTSTRPQPPIPISANETIPENQLVIAENNLDASLSDGSSISANKGSCFTISSQATGTTVHLQHGSIMAHVATQVPGKNFSIRTNIGEATAIGTRYQVMCEADLSQAAIQEAPAKHMIVNVQEGVVRVQSAQTTTELHAGESRTIAHTEGAYSPKVISAKGGAAHAKL